MRLKLALLIVSFLVIGSVLMGCGSSDIDKAAIISGELLKTEKTLPVNFYELAEQGVLVKKVTNQAEYNEQWDYYQLKEKPSEIDWSKKEVIFLGIFESGSCPYEFKSVELNDEKTEIIFHIEVDSKKQACTDDATPRTIVLAVDADVVSDVTLVKISNYNGINPKVQFYEDSNKGVN
ncbi:hypothetical protein RJD24_07095 [Bacillaceae bacterium IKA-2]|nr:hypothetical protein RJD24_07095 [Bacillaceae bacterium IKA-2]